MTVELIDPADLATPQTYTHVGVASGKRLVFVAGQVAEDERGNLVGPADLAAEARQAFRQSRPSPCRRGRRPGHVAKITIFVLDLPEGATARRSRRARALFGEHKPADAVIGVQALAQSGWLIEVDAIPEVDAHRL